MHTMYADGSKNSIRADLDATIFPYDYSRRLPQHESCRLNQSYNIFTTVAHAQHEKCRTIYKHVAKPYNGRSHTDQNVKMTSCIRFFA